MICNKNVLDIDSQQKLSFMRLELEAACASLLLVIFFNMSCENVNIMRCMHASFKLEFL